MTKTPRQIMDEQMSEKDFENTVVEYAQRMGWKVIHIPTIKAENEHGEVYYLTPYVGDGKGFPDWIFIRERVVWPELKKQKGKLSDDQKKWRDWLLAAKQEWYCWRPSDWEQIVEILK